MIHRILRGLESRSTLREPPDYMWDAWAGPSSYSGKRVGVDDALGLAAVWAAVTLLASGVSGVPLIIYLGQGKDRTRRNKSPRWKLLHDEPNPEQTADMFYETITAQLNLWGNCYIEKVKKQGVVKELWPINPARVSVERDSQQRKQFTIDGASKTLGEDTILHIPALMTTDTGVGLSPIQYARQTLGNLSAKQEFAGRFYANDATPGGVLTVPARLSDEAASRLKASWEAKHRGMDKAGRVAVLEEGAKWEQMGMPFRDQQWIEAEQFSATQIAAIFHVPADWIGGTTGDSLTYANVEMQALHFVKFYLRRWFVRIEKGLYRDRDLFPNRDEYPEFLIEAMLRGSSDERATFYERMQRIGALSVNEIRELENRPPVEGGDTFGQPEPPKVDLEASDDEGDKSDAGGEKT